MSEYYVVLFLAIYCFLLGFAVGGWVAFRYNVHAKVWMDWLWRKLTGDRC